MADRPAAPAFNVTRNVRLLEAFFRGVSLLAEIPTGACSDRFRRRVAFGAAVTIEATGIALFAFAAGYVALLAAYVLWSLGMALRPGNDSACLHELLASEGPGDDFPRVYGRLFAIGAAATALGRLGRVADRGRAHAAVAVHPCARPIRRQSGACDTAP